MKLLHIGDGHIRNVEFIQRACKLFKIDYIHTHNHHPADENYDIIWAPTSWINPDHYPQSKIIFGPHFWVFPDTHDPLYTNSKTEHSNRCIYICLCDWVSELFKEFLPAEKIVIRHVGIPFGIGEIEHEPTKKLQVDYDCILYYKDRCPRLFDYCEGIIRSKGLRYKVIRYGSYRQEDYTESLYKTKFVVWIGRHESQGFALEECMTTNTPVYLYDVESMKDECVNGCFIYQEHSSKTLKATAAPYWDDKCGIRVHSKDEFSNRLDEFINRLDEFRPIDYVKSHLTDSVCFRRILKELDIQA